MSGDFDVTVVGGTVIEDTRQVHAGSECTVTFAISAQCKCATESNGTLQVGTNVRPCSGEKIGPCCVVPFYPAEVETVPIEVIPIDDVWVDIGKVKSIKGRVEDLELGEQGASIGAAT